MAGMMKLSLIRNVSILIGRMVPYDLRFHVATVQDIY